MLVTAHVISQDFNRHDIALDCVLLKKGYASTEIKDHVCLILGRHACSSLVIGFITDDSVFLDGCKEYVNSDRLLKTRKFVAPKQARFMMKFHVLHDALLTILSQSSY